MFSSAVVLSDLNDFIEPSQECIKPVSIDKSALESKVSLRNGNYYEVEKDGSEQVLKEAAITLNDCLACSGCITSAETVLIAMQHEQELLSALKDRNGKIIVISISSQSRASLGSKWGMNKQEIWNALCFYFKSVLGVDDIFDIDFARDLSLLSTGKEFLDRFSTGRAMLSSACPGWICYAEKTHPIIIPLLDTSKSPQQVMGSLVKDYYAKRRGLSPMQIYHVTVMPCYDKKLEASRQEYFNDIYSTRDVDLVLSTSEVEKLVSGSQLDPRQIPLNQFYHSLFLKGSGGVLAKSTGSLSGGYLEWTMRYAVKTLYNISLSSNDVNQGCNGVSIVPGRNLDFTSVNYTPPGSPSPTLRFAYAYGFRNIQNLVRKLKQKRGPLPYHFVEVMACPSGCINGGGQARNDSDDKVTKEWIDAASAVYCAPADIVDPDCNLALQEIYLDWFAIDPTLERRMLHTSFKAVENLNESGLAVKW